jgi:competence protein ComEA
LQKKIQTDFFEVSITPLMKRKKIKSPVLDYFNFSTRERRGVFFLTCILLLQLMIIYYFKHRPVNISYPDPKIISAILEFAKASKKDVIESEKDISNLHVSYFYFDPNVINENSFEKLGFNTKQIHVIKNYLSHNGKFRIKSDFKKMYCVSEEEYNALESYILLPDSLNEKRFEKRERKNLFQPVDIGISDSITLMSLKGIGPVLASRIIKYREKLGGFYSLYQLKEVWGIDDTLFLSLATMIKLNDTIPFRYIHLNSDSFPVLASHPYIKGKLAGLICNYRKQHKTIVEVDELKQLPLITEENFLKLAPYLSPD